MDLAGTDEVENTGERTDETDDSDTIANDVFTETKLSGAEGEHRKECTLSEQPARVDFPEEEKELCLEHMGALEAEAGVVEQLGIGQRSEGRHAKTGTTHFFGGWKRPLRARERRRSATRART